MSSTGTTRTDSISSGPDEQAPGGSAAATAGGISAGGGVTEVGRAAEAAGAEEPFRLSSLTKRFLMGVAFSALGNGLVLPFLMVYLHNVRGIATATVGAALAWQAALGLALAAPAGSLVDRIGPRPVLAGGVTIMGLGTFSLAFVERPWQAFLAATVMAVGGAGLWSPTSAMLASMVPAVQRQRVFGIQFALLNLGIGVGGLIASVVVDVDRVRTFQVLYALDALTFFGFAVLLLTIRGAGGPVRRSAAESGVDDPRSGDGEGWWLVLRDRVLRRVFVMALLAISSGYAQFEAGYTAFATQQADLEPKLLGIAFAVNTGMIVASQMLVLRRLQGRSRTRALTLVLVIWASSWLFVGAAGLVPGTGLATALLIVAPAIFAVGETMWAPITPAIVNDLAPPELRGRYNATVSMTWSVSLIIGPLVAGLLIGSGLSALWIVVIVGGSLMAALMATRLRAHLTPEQDGRV
jgi:MFS family permease